MIRRSFKVLRDNCVQSPDGQWPAAGETVTVRVANTSRRDLARTLAWISRYSGFLEEVEPVATPVLVDQEEPAPAPEPEPAPVEEEPDGAVADEG